jgi:transposase
MIVYMNWCNFEKVLYNHKPTSMLRYFLPVNDIEESFDVMKNLLQADIPYLRDNETLRGYLFTSFLSLIAYYRTLKVLKKKGMNRRISVKDVILQHSKIYMTDVGEKTIAAEIPKKVRELAELLELNPDLFHKSVLS